MHDENIWNLTYSKENCVFFENSQVAVGTVVYFVTGSISKLYNKRNPLRWSLGNFMIFLPS